MTLPPLQYCRAMRQHLAVLARTPKEANKLRFVTRWYDLLREGTMCCRMYDLLPEGAISYYMVRFVTRRYDVLPEVTEVLAGTICYQKVRCVSGRCDMLLQGTICY